MISVRARRYECQRCGACMLVVPRAVRNRHGARDVGAARSDRGGRSRPMSAWAIDDGSEPLVVRRFFRKWRRGVTYGAPVASERLAQSRLSSADEVGENDDGALVADQVIVIDERLMLGEERVACDFERVLEKDDRCELRRAHEVGYGRRWRRRIVCAWAPAPLRHGSGESVADVADVAEALPARSAATCCR